MKKIILAILAFFCMTLGLNAQTEQLITGLTKTLTRTAERFEKSNHAFIINIIKDNNVVIQILHGGMIEQVRTKGNEFNFSFNLPFENDKVRQNKFTSLEISNEFTYYEWDGIPCYALNVGNNKDKAKQIALTIMNEVYGFESNEQFEFEIYDQGKL